MIETTTGQVVIGGKYDIPSCYIPLTVIDNASPDDPVMQEEIFGPILPIIGKSSLYFLARLFFKVLWILKIIIE